MTRSTVLSIVLSSFGLLAASPAAFSAPKVIINQGQASPCTITPNAGTVFTMSSTGDVLVNGSYGPDCPTQPVGTTGNPSFSPFSPAPADLAITPNSTGSGGGSVTPSFT